MPFVRCYFLFIDVSVFLTHRFQPHVLARCCDVVENMWEKHMIRAASARNVLDSLKEAVVDAELLETTKETKLGARLQLDETASASAKWGDVFKPGTEFGTMKNGKEYQSLLTRNTAASYEERLDSMSEAKKVRVQMHADYKAVREAAEAPGDGDAKK
jgi:hypothetical protein